MPEINIRTIPLLIPACICLPLLVGCGPDEPSAPTGLSANSQDESLSLNWNAVEGGDVTGYNLYRSTNQFSETSEARKVNESLVKKPSYTDDGVTNGNKYYYRTAAVAESGGFLGIGGGMKESDPSEDVAKTPFSSPPGRP